MNPLYQLGKGINICFDGDIVVCILVVRTNVDDNDICRLLIREIPGLGAIWISFSTKPSR